MANTLNLGNGNWATKEDSLLAYNSENGNFKPLPFDFTRASSATVVNKDGLIETVGSGEPRIDFSNDAKGALLLEPQSTNLVTYSEDFSNAAWTGGGITISGGYLAPDGSDNAYKVSSSGGVFNGDFGLIESTTRSIYARTVSGAGKISLLSYFGNSNNLFDITEEWQRFEVSTSISTGSNSFYAVDFRSSSATLSEVIIWGANATNDQSYATSYIPTQGQSGGVTRVADVSSLSNNAFVDPQNGNKTYTFNFSLPSIDGVSVYDLMSKFVDNSNRFRLSFRSSQPDFELYMKIGGVNLVFIVFSAALVANTDYELKIVINNGVSNQVYLNGVLQTLTSDTHSAGNITLNTPFYLGSYHTALTSNVNLKSFKTQ